MAVTVSYPGVYIDEVSSGVHTITSVSTSIAAFFGRTSKGPLNKAVRCLSLADFLRNFGAPHPESATDKPARPAAMIPTVGQRQSASRSLRAAPRLQWQVACHRLVARCTEQNQQLV